MGNVGRTWYVRLDQTPSALVAVYGTWHLRYGTQVWDHLVIGRTMDTYTEREMLQELYGAVLSFQERWV